MNNEDLFKRILNKVCIHFGYDVAHDLEYLFLTKEQEIEQLKEEIKSLYKYTPEEGFRRVEDVKD
ncbi:MAG: hypothetical protein IKN65_00635 [Clostridia bacterium]|nr:hypothetical protein [Bacilli bacterium]MBR3672789.1 hypothetical protein [Clostridia bacterium]